MKPVPLSAGPLTGKTMRWVKKSSDPSVGVPAHQAGVDRLVITEAVAAEVLDQAGARPRHVPGQTSPFTGVQRARLGHSGHTVNLYARKVALL